RRRHTRWPRDWSSDVCSSDLVRAVFFDLFDTLVRFDRDRLPEVTIAGRTVRSTAGHLHPILRAWSPDLTLETFHKALQESWQERSEERRVGKEWRSRRCG